MERRWTFQKLVLGDEPIVEEAQRRKLLLGAYLIIMYMGIDAFFFIVNLFNPFGSVASLLGGVIVSVLCLAMIRRKWINLAIILHLIRTNFLAFFFSTIDEDPYQTASYIFFIPSCLGALAVFGYEDRLKGIGFTVISLVLFLIAMFDPTKFAPDQAHFYFIFNFLIVVTIGVLILLFFDRLVVTSETKILQKNKELEKANTALDRFVYSVSHDLRAPLSSILGLVSIYKYSAGDQERRDIIDHIEKRALKLDEFIREILNYARNTRMEVRRQPVEMKSLVREVTENLRFIKGYERIKMSADVRFDGTVQLDAERIKVILNNLLSNAIKYQDMTKEEPFVNITIDKSDSDLDIRIEDNGVGIRTEHIPRVFEMFYRANDTVEGSGLGLYIVKETVESLDGRVEMTSEFAKGTTFRIFIPLTG